MEQRQLSASTAESAYVSMQRQSPLQPLDASIRACATSSEVYVPRTHIRQPPPSPSSGSSPSGKPDYLPKSSVLYIFCAGNLFLAVCYLALHEQSCISRAHYEDLKVNLRPPWIPYRWLGSTGVDVTDLQWYYFVVALPPVAPYLIAFLFLSRRLRRFIASRPGAAISTTSHHHHHHHSSPNAGNAAVKAHVVESQAVAFGTPNHNNSSSSAATAAMERLGNGKDSPDPSSFSAAVAVKGDDSPRKQGGVAAAVAAAVVTTPSPSSSSPLPRMRLDTAPLHIFHFFSGAFIAFCISGPGFLFGLALMSLNYLCIAPLYKKLSFRACMTIMWVSHIAILFLNFHAGGYKFAWLGLSFLDSLWTPLISWNVQYNMTILRMISFNNDLWESVFCGEERRQKSLQKHERSCTACAQIRDQNKHAAATLPQEAVSCYKCRTECSRAVPEYTFSAYLGYMFYLPLFMAGPLSSFNAYVSYMHYPQRSVIGGATWRYGLRWLGHAILLCTLMHYVHIMAMVLTPTASKMADAAAAATTTTTATPEVVEALVEAVTGLPVTSITRATGPPVLDSMKLPQKSVLFFLVLTFLWAKFDVIWRFFRFFALLDGFDPPEDMPRCFANTVNIQSFWRDWHASFNQWIVRYMYVPMGGSRTKFLSIFPIFFFIAVWHDIEMRLLFWAFFICIGFIPEILVTTFFASKSNAMVLRIKRHRLLWRSLRILGTQLCLMELAVANLVGFAVGTSGTEAGLRQLFTEVTTTFMLYSPFLFFCAATLAIQDRDQRTYEAAQQKLKYNLL
jgi:protein-cysteine N-palmitoyltransferase HHAT